MATLEKPTPTPVAFQASGGPEAVHAGRRPWSGERPSRLGPRQPGQSAGGAARRPAGSARPRTNAARGRRIAKDMGETPLKAPVGRLVGLFCDRPTGVPKRKASRAGPGDNVSQLPALTALRTQVRMHGPFNGA